MRDFRPLLYFSVYCYKFGYEEVPLALFCKSQPITDCSTGADVLGRAGCVWGHRTFSSGRQLRDWTVIVQDEHGNVIGEQGIKFSAKGRALHGNVLVPKGSCVDDGKSPG